MLYKLIINFNITKWKVVLFRRIRVQMNRFFGSSRNQNQVKKTVDPTVLPAAMQTDSSFSREWITYDKNVKTVPILVSTGR